MKRKVLSVILTAVLMVCLCACGTEAVGQDTSAEAVSKVYDAVNYTIEREDVSVKDAEGNYILKAFYDRVVVNEEGAVAEKINAQLKEAGDAFIKEAQAAADFAQEMASYGRLHKYYSEAEVVTNADGFLSIRLTQNFYSGGQYDVDTIVGMNFNLKTGEKLKITDVFPTSEAETVQYLKEMTRGYANASGIWALKEGVNDLVDGYTADHFDFYIQEGVPYLCYVPNAFGSESIGAIVIACPIQGIKVMLKGEYIYFDQPPIMQNDRVLVPMRAIFEAMGYNVIWEQETQTAYADHGTRSIAITVGNPVIQHAYGSYTCDVAPVNIAGRVLVPVRAISELSGYTVDWEQETLTVLITNPLA